MVEKRLGKAQMNKGLVFLLIFLVAVGAFFIYAKLSFTGYVTNVGNATNGVLLSSNTFDTGDFSNTFVNSQGNIALMPTKTTGTYISQIFDASQPAIWINFVPTYLTHSSVNYTEDPSNNTLLLYVRSCDDSSCTGKDFSLFDGTLNAIGQYFQYKVEMQIHSGNETPLLSEINVSYYPPLSLPINVTSPQAVTYNNESVPISISSNNGTTIWFYNGTENETYSGTVNRTYAEGQHTLAVWASYADGNVVYTNYTTVTFTVGFLHSYYRYASNACSQINLTEATKTANDYNTLADCQTHITSSNTTTTDTTTTPQNCAAQWQCENWSDCIDGTQTRVCYDTSTCTGVTSVEGRPPQEQSCIGGIVTTSQETVTIQATETPTTTEQPKKSFLSSVGSVILTPVKTVTGTVISVLVLLLVAGGFIAFKMSKKKTLGAFFNSIAKGIRREKFE